MTHCVRAGLRFAMAVFAISWATVAPSAPLRGVAQVSGGGEHTCALNAQGGLQCWGENSGGQLGDGTRSDRLLPVDVLGLTQGVVEVSAGSEHTCARLQDGSVRCWGLNFSGQIGNGVGGFGTFQPVPAVVAGLPAPAIAISAGTNHSCAVLAGGAVWCWGRNDAGQLGDGTTTDRFQPVPVAQVTSGAGAVIAAGSETSGFTCVRTTGGALRCWGTNRSGQLGDGTTTSRSAPADVVGFSSGALSVGAGGEHGCGLTAAGGGKCWGSNSWGHLGSFGFGDPNSPTPRDVTNLPSGALVLSARDELTCALMGTGRVQCWGVTHFPPGGVFPVFTLTPADQGFDNVVSLSVGGAPYALTTHVCVVRNDTGVQCKGGNRSGQLGGGFTGDYMATAVDVMSGPRIFSNGFEQ